MDNEIERNLGEQPISNFLAINNLKPSDIVNASSEQISFKMIQKACKGRRLTKNIKSKILRAVNKATDNNLNISDLFNY